MAENADVETVAGERARAAAERRQKQAAETGVRRPDEEIDRANPGEALDGEDTGGDAGR